MKSFAYDLGYLRAGLELLEAYLLAEDVFWPIDASPPEGEPEYPRLTLGGTYFASSGSGPTRYYQPLGRFSVPLGRHVQWNSEWRWYGFNEPFYLYEGFRTHHFVTGLRLGL